VSVVFNPASPAVPVRPARRRLAPIGIAVAVVVAALAVLAAVQFARPVPPDVLRLSVPASLSIPGRVADLPWPAQGQARLDVDGLGTLGTSGDSRPVPIGSVAKVMTAFVVLADHPLDADQEGPRITVTAADVADYRARIPGGQSLVPVVAGERLTQRQALQALMLPSANNVAQILANWDAGGVDGFVAKMNATAAALGLTATHYTDPSGFAPSTVSIAADQTVLAEHALRVPAFADTVALQTATLPVAGTVHNYNSLLGIDGVFGVKTGSTDEAGGNLVFAAHLTVAGQTLTVVGAVLNQPGKKTSEQLAAVDEATRKLLAVVKRVVHLYTLLPAARVGEVHVAWSRSVLVRTAAPAKVIGWPGLTVRVEVHAALPGRPLPAGQRLGTLTLRTGIADATVELRSDARLSGPSWWWRLTRTR
jgi:serine-type D-Ala-D-Ala carboxypeptidase (penicillin-binding protein 5/6)